MHVDQPARFLPGLFHPVEAEAGVHLVGELAALQPLESGHGRAIVPGGGRGAQQSCEVTGIVYRADKTHAMRSS